MLPAFISHMFQSNRLSENMNLAEMTSLLRPALAHLAHLVTEEGLTLATLDRGPLRRGSVVVAVAGLAEVRSAQVLMHLELALWVCERVVQEKAQQTHSAAAIGCDHIVGLEMPLRSERTQIAVEPDA